jgi:hypothetical protein
VGYSRVETEKLTKYGFGVPNSGEKLTQTHKCICCFTLKDKYFGRRREVLLGGGAKAQFHIFLTSTLDGGNSSRFNDWEIIGGARISVLTAVLIKNQVFRDVRS